MARRVFGIGLWLAACGGSPPTPDVPAAAPTPPTAASEARSPPPSSSKETERGTVELVRELVRADRLENVAERFRKKTELLAAIRQLADPRGADALHEYATSGSNSQRSPGERTRFETLATFALAELGDARAIRLLATRLALDPMTIYDESAEQIVLKRDDQERVIASRLIADLAELHPDLGSEVRAIAARGLDDWLRDRPAPHANAMRARARLHIEDPAVRKQQLEWADPKTPLPKKSAQPPFPMEFAVAQSALRWLGASKHPKAADVLKKQLQRRPKGFDGTMDGLLLQGSALLGMTLRALASGAAHGLAELGDPKAVPWLLAYIDDDLENEQSRTEACQALAWTLPDGESAQLTKRLKSWSAKRTPEDDFRTLCLLDGLVLRTSDALVPLLLAIVKDPQSNPLAVVRAAKALGRHGLDATTEAALLAELEGSRSEAAAVAIALGGSPNAVQGLAKHAASAKGSWLPTVISEYADAVRTTYADDLSNGRFLRWVENAPALGFAADALQKAVRDAEFDSGPKSLTRVVLRGRLRAIAEKAGPDQKRAIRAFELLGERGMLLALAEKDGAAGSEARAALQRSTAPAP
jgi:hypothetical protein